MTDLLFVVAGIVFLILGIILFLQGRKGRRVGDHPVCSACEFNLTGKPTTSDRCPECGNLLAGSVRIGNKRQRVPYIVFGFALAAIGITAVFVTSLRAVRAVDWLPYWPTSWLIDGIMGNDPVAEARSLAEYKRRDKLGEVSLSQQSAFADRLLIRQGDLKSPWKRAHGELLDALFLSNSLSAAQHERYLNQILVLTTKSRKVARIGADLPIATDFEFRGVIENFNGLSLDDSETGVSVKNGPPLVSQRPWLDGGFQMLNGELTLSDSVRLDATALSPGTTVVVVKKRVRVKREVFSGKNTDFVDKVYSLEVPIALVDTNQSVVRFVAEPESVEKIKAHLAVRNPHAENTPHSILRTRGRGSRSDSHQILFYANNLNVNLAFDVYLRSQGIEQNVGSFGIAPGVHGTWGVGCFPKGLEGAESVDVILRSNKQVAEQTIDVEEIWPGEIVYSDVQIIDWKNDGK